MPGVFDPLLGSTIAFYFQEDCRQIVDKYIEYDSVMIFLDALLHKPQAYRHLLYNASMQVHIFKY